jgi:HD superfamily phosphohydrolase
MLSKTKLFKDIIHDSIEITPVAQSIIDTKIFQRLRNLHQVGVCYFVFPNANNNRFEHSIGTYHLAGKLLDNIVKNSKCSEINKALLEIDFIKNYLLKHFELGEDEEGIGFLEKVNAVLLDDYLIELVKIAGLVHDLGHGPFSHLFDEWIHNNHEIKDSELAEHEARSILLFKEIIDTQVFLFENENYLLKEFINQDAFKFISELINPTKDTPSNFIFQIISNSLNGLDVDKLDYLNRDSYYLGCGSPFDLYRVINHVKVINKNICFPEKVSYDIYKIYRSRYDLHKQYYNHKTTIRIEYMIRDILALLDPILKISESIKNKNLNKFIDLVDSTIMNTTSTLKNIPEIYQIYKNNIDSVENIIENINSRNLYKCIYSDLFYISQNIDKKQIINNTIDEYEKNNNAILDKDLVFPVFLKIGLLSGNKSHPFDNLYFYDKNDNASILEKNKISHLITPLFQELILYIIYKK